LTNERGKKIRSSTNAKKESAPPKRSKSIIGGNYCAGKYARKPKKSLKEVRTEK